MGFVVKKPGMCTTVQDRGRIGYQGSGFSTSGVMDLRAMRIANILVDNDLDSAVLEFALVGPSLRFTTNTFIALTGGDFSPQLDGKPVKMYCALPVSRGMVLSFGAPVWGTYGYIAIAGGMRIDDVMGSVSTNLRCSIGGWKGRKLAHGDFIPFRKRDVDYLPMLESHAVPVERRDPGQTHLRVVLGPQVDCFTQEGIRTFLEEPFTVTPEFDRMGCRLEGPVVETVNGSDIISDGIALGAVQIPSHGRPIIMLVDRQTTGGYAKIGTVATVDIPKLVQSSVGDVVRFDRIDVHEAQRLYCRQAEELRAMSIMVHRPCEESISPRRAARRLTPILENQAKVAQRDIIWIKDRERMNER